MARTYEEYLVDAIANNPAPPVRWELHDPDVEHDHFENVAAIGRYTLPDGEQIYEIEVSGTNNETLWYVHKVDDPEGPRSQYARFTSWEAVKQYVSGWAATEIIETQRQIATELFVHDLLDDEGISYPVTTPLAARLLGLHMSSSPQLNMVYTPVFSSETLEYAIETSISPVTLTATAPSGATIAWAHGGVTGTMAAFMVALVQGANVITCTVSSEGHSASTYTITITKP